MTPETAESKRKLLYRFKRRLLSQKFFDNNKQRSPLRRSLADKLLQYPPRLVLIGFAITIALGTILLSLPQATASNDPLPFSDALFTATSATCVTGLIVVDTGTAFSTFGQIVILALIQVGGLGIMTLSTFFIFVLSGRLGLTGREALIDTLSQKPQTELTRLLKLVFFFTILIETGGWIVLSLRFASYLPLPEAAFQGLFHAVSAFCNAGFSLFSNSFVDYKSDPVINLVLGALIIAGGLGFVVLLDLYNNRYFFKRESRLSLSFHTHLVLVSTLALILTGFVFFFGLEYSNSLKNLSLPDKILASLLQSVTARTAGFNTVPIETLADSTLFLLMILMFIGASPGSCGGGIKTTTFVVVLASIFGRSKMRDEVNVFYRRIPEPTVSRVISIVFFSIAIIILFTGLLLVFELPQISHTQSQGRFLDIAFEVVSAFGTVGLSTGITASLTATGKILITVLMYIGRLGPLTIALAVRGRKVAPKFKYLQDDVMVG